MKTIIASVLLMANLVAHAETGWIYHGDLNGDGVFDKIESGPMETFGTGGGVYVVTISSNGDTEHKAYSIGGSCFAIEHAPNKQIRLWTFLHMSSQEGVLTSYMFTPKEMKQEMLTINPGDGGTEMSNAIMDALFNDETRIEFDKVENYTAPPNPSGLEWGK